VVKILLNLWKIYFDHNPYKEIIVNCFEIIDMFKQTTPGDEIPGNEGAV